jgi:signal peptidase I
MAWSGAIGQPAHRWVFRALVAISAMALLVVAFLLGRQYQATQATSPAGSVLGLRDYQQLATYNHYSIVRAYGPSMQPTFAMYNFLLVRDTQHIARGQILVSGHHGIHRVVGLPGETVRLSSAGIQVCGPAGARCRLLAQPWRHIPPATSPDATSVQLDDAYATLPDNRQCCDYLIVVPRSDVVGVVAGSLLSYGPTTPDGALNKPVEPTLEYER